MAAPLSARVLAPLRHLVRRARLERAMGRSPATLDEVRGRLPPEPPAPDSRPRLERLLQENILPFWYPATIDERHGGFHLNHDADGRDLGPAPKDVIAQARMTWFFARLARSPYGRPEHLTAAGHGHALLTSRFLDDRYGGYFWRFDPAAPDLSAGAQRKDLCTQAFVLYALTEYALASGDPGVRAQAQELYRLIERHAPDQKFGGYLELFERDWQPAPARTPNFHSELHADHKSFACQVHLLEAMTRLCDLTPGEAPRAALGDLADLVMKCMIHGPAHVLVNVHSRDWRPVYGHVHNRSNFGHQLELVWMLGEALTAAGRDVRSERPILEALFADAVRNGLDTSAGGFYAGGLPGRPATRREKTWWVQAEALLCSSYLYRQFRDPSFAACLNRTLGWIVGHQADWDNGEWHAVVDERSNRSGAKAGPWKAAYHTGRAVLHSLELLDAADATPAERDPP